MFKDIKLYWKYYGGTPALFRSTGLYLSIIFSLLSHKFFFNQWFEMPISIIPNILGFTLGGYALALSFGSSKFQNILMKKKDNTLTPFEAFNGAFCHFIFVQTITLLYALLNKALCPDNKIFAFIGVTLLYYTILSALLSTFAILNLADWHQEIYNIQEEFVCPVCKEEIKEHASKCKHCGNLINQEQTNQSL